MFLHPAMWIISGVLICVIGISLESVVLLRLPHGPVRNGARYFQSPTGSHLHSGADTDVALLEEALPDLLEQGQGHLQQECARPRGPEVTTFLNIFEICYACKQICRSFYVDTGEKRCFFVALHRNRVVGTAAIREAPGDRHALSWNVSKN